VFGVAVGVIGLILLISHLTERRAWGTAHRSSLLLPISLLLAPLVVVPALLFGPIPTGQFFFSIDAKISLTALGVMVAVIGLILLIARLAARRAWIALVGVVIGLVLARVVVGGIGVVGFLLLWGEDSASHQTSFTRAGGSDAVENPNRIREIEEA